MKLNHLGQAIKQQMPYRIVKQFVVSSNTVFVATLSGSVDKLWEFDSEASASVKMNELSSSDSSGRKYKIIEI